MKPGLILSCLCVVLASVGAATAAQAATIWDEASNGDLSNDGLSPTPLVMGVGSNRVLGTTGNSGQGTDRDYFKFTVPAGAKLTSIVLLPNTAISGSVSFIGIQPGPQLTVTPTGGGVENLIALGHYGNDQIGTDLLPSLEVSVTGPLPAGTYSVWVQDTGGPAFYGFDFVTSATTASGPTPAPALPGWGTPLLGLLLALVYCWQVAPRRQHRSA